MKNEKDEAMMALVRGVVALSEVTREIASAEHMDYAQIAKMKARTAEISRALTQIQPSATCDLGPGEIPEPLATSASSQPTQSVKGLDALFD